MDHRKQRGYEGILDYNRVFMGQARHNFDKHTNLKIKFTKQRLGRLILMLNEGKKSRCERMKKYWTDKKRIY